VQARHVVIDSFRQGFGLRGRRRRNSIRTIYKKSKSQLRRGLGTAYVRPGLRVSSYALVSRQGVST
jgi:hypothetical protein